MDARSGVARAPFGAPAPRLIETAFAVVVAGWAVVVSAAREDATSERRATAVDAVKCMVVDLCDLLFVI